MPVTTEQIRGKYRVVESDGKIALNRAGTAIDGGGHDTASQARAQARAVNAATESKKGDYDSTLCLWVRVPDVVRPWFEAMVGRDLPDDIHVTLLYWPEIESDFTAEVVAASLDLGMRSLPATTATVTGVAEFFAGVVVALISMPEAERYRSVARFIDEPDPASEFGLVPHVTLARFEPGEDVPDVSVPFDPISWPVTELEVVRGGRVIRTIRLMR